MGRKNRGFLCRLSKVWFFVIGGFVAVELCFLGLLAGSLSHLNLNAASARRKFLRWINPQWRSQKRRPRLDAPALKTPPFHHAQWIYRRNFAKYKEILQQDNPKPLDDFYSRPHIPAASQQVPFLVVGGSDGSGTRTFVQALMDLGVDMIVDSYDTLDVHGEEMEFFNEQLPLTDKLTGWPPLATKILNETHSLNYTVHNLSKNTHQIAIAALVKLRSSLVKKGREVARKNREPGHVPSAAGVQYGFKAPVAMVCLPILQQVLGPIKFIHVVRDGRDVAFSDNQSPVEKFYQVFYGRNPLVGGGENRLIEAMELWKDWNLQAWKWAQDQVHKVDDKNIPSLDYLVMRTEDFIDPTTKLEALAQLAEFVGARLSPEDLCCLSKKGFTDLGRSKDRFDGENQALLLPLRGIDEEAESKVKARYGKWKQKLQDKPEMLAKLNKVGGEALRLFGYEPSVSFLDRSDDLQAYQCDETESFQRKIDCSF